MTEAEFIRNEVVKPIRALLDDGHHRAAFILMAQSIEVLGSFLDAKPFRARSQSKIRFRNALYFLFPGLYSAKNRGDKLYEQFRSQMTHMFIPSAHLKLQVSGTNHLELEDDKLVLNAQQLADDIAAAGEKLIQKLERGEVKRKRLPFIDTDIKNA
ncbi:MAG: hypothetical protein PF448_02995 [Bacteroidales bacterium]|jgi:hypothetical protein|nr:hypothetical protein [Bacteroidales bacterium]